MISSTEKNYSLEQVKALLKNSRENLKSSIPIVRLYPSQQRMVENYRLAYKEAQKLDFNADIEYKSLIVLKKDKWKFGFIKSFSAKEKSFKTIYHGNADWAVNMFEGIYKRLDFNTITQWQNTVLQTKRVQEEVKAMVEYYRVSAYFTSYISLVDAGKRLTEEQYNKLCKNKYADKVLEAHFAEPLFNVGEFVSLRGSTDGLKHRGLHKGMFVLSNTETITSARKGCKKYKLLPVGGTKPLLYEEYQLKKYKKPKKSE